jgi:hypothetical protein
MIKMDRTRVVGIATRYGLDLPGIESHWERDFPHPSRPAICPSELPVQEIRGHSQEKRPGRSFNHSPHLASRLNKDKICTSILCLCFYGRLYGEFYLFHEKKLCVYLNVLSNVR